MSLITPYTNLDPNSGPEALRQMRLSHQSFPQSDLDYSASDQTSQQPYTTEFILEKLKPLTHDLLLEQIRFIPTKQDQILYRLSSPKQKFSLELQLPVQRAEKIKEDIHREVNEFLSYRIVEYHDKIEGHSRILTNNERNGILKAYFNNEMFVFYDIADLLQIIALPFLQDEPDWSLTIRPSPLYIDPGQVPYISHILLQQCLENATSLEFD